MPHCRIWGHRGSPRHAPENTLASLEAAVRSGAHGVEFDVQCTADLVPILLHDATLDRTSNGRGPVQATTADRIRSLDAGSWFGAKFRGERVPSLDDVLDWLAARAVEGVLEIKDGRPEAIRRYVEAVRKRGLKDRVYFHSFAPADLRAVRERWSDARIQLIGPCGPGLLLRAHELRANAVSPYDETLTANDIPADLAASARSQGMELNAGLVNDRRLYETLSARGVGAVFTDVPGELTGGMVDG